MLVYAIYLLNLLLKQSTNIYVIIQFSFKLIYSFTIISAKNSTRQNALDVSSGVLVNFNLAETLKCVMGLLHIYMKLSITTLKVVPLVTQNGNAVQSSGIL